MPSSCAILALSEGSAPEASTRMSAMLPGTSRSITKISTDIPNKVRTINRKRRTRYAPMTTASLSVVLTEAERSEAQWRDLVSTTCGLSSREGPSAPLRSGRDDGTPSLVQPDVFETPAVVDAVHLQHDALDL